MNTKQQLLQNPLVKEIALKFANEFRVTELCENMWDEFVKSNEPVREWEILEFKIHSSGDLVTLRKNGLYLNSIQYNEDGSFTLEETLAKLNHSIFSVRRNSDKEVFTVGDRVDYGKNGTITKFSLSNVNDGLYVDVKFDTSTEYCNAPISSISKLKQPLFKTHNGKDVWENQVVLMLDKHSWTTRPIAASEAMIIDFGYYKDKEKLNLEFFSNDVAAQEYITLNKPCLSVSDVTKIAGQYPENYFKNTPHIVYQFTLDELITLAKSKQANS